MDAKSNEQKYDEKSVPSQSIFSQDTNYKGEKNALFNYWKYAPQVQM